MSYHKDCSSDEHEDEKSDSEETGENAHTEDEDVAGENKLLDEAVMAWAM